MMLVLSFIILLVIVVAIRQGKKHEDANAKLKDALRDDQ